MASSSQKSLSLRAL